MNTAMRRSRPHPSVIPFVARPIAASADDLAIARQRMRHLVPWRVEPLPMMHSVVGTPAERPPPEERERSEHLALQVLAVQMWQAAAMSALD
jgi:hypothetical protein